MSEKSEKKRNRTPVLYLDDAGGHHKTAIEARSKNRQIEAVKRIRTAVAGGFLMGLRLRMEKETGDEELLGDLAEMLWDIGLIVHTPRGPATPKQATFDDLDEDCRTAHPTISTSITPE